MTNQQPITPPLELVRRLSANAFAFSKDGMPTADIHLWLIQHAYAAGANQDLLRYSDSSLDIDD